MPKVSTGLTISAAETLAAQALGAMAADPVLFDRFLGETGLSLGGLRSAASEPGFLAGVLDFILRDEEALVALAETAGVRPELVVAAHARLTGQPSADGG